MQLSAALSVAWLGDLDFGREDIKGHIEKAFLLLPKNKIEILFPPTDDRILVQKDLESKKTWKQISIAVDQLAQMIISVKTIVNGKIGFVDIYPRSICHLATIQPGEEYLLSMKIHNVSVIAQIAKVPSIEKLIELQRIHLRNYFLRVYEFAINQTISLYCQAIVNLMACEKYPLVKIMNLSHESCRQEIVLNMFKQLSSEEIQACLDNVLKSQSDTIFYVFFNVFGEQRIKEMISDILRSLFINNASAKDSIIIEEYANCFLWSCRMGLIKG